MMLKAMEAEGKEVTIEYDGSGDSGEIKFKAGGKDMDWNDELSQYLYDKFSPYFDENNDGEYGSCTLDLKKGVILKDGYQRSSETRKFKRSVEYEDGEELLSGFVKSLQFQIEELPTNSKNLIKEFIEEGPEDIFSRDQLWTYEREFARDLVVCDDEQVLVNKFLRRAFKIVEAMIDDNGDIEEEYEDGDYIYINIFFEEKSCNIEIAISVSTEYPDVQKIPL